MFLSQRHCGVRTETPTSELAFWLGATPNLEALPTPHADGSTRNRPAQQSQTAGSSRAIGPHSQKPAKRRKV